MGEQDWYCVEVDLDGNEIGERDYSVKPVAPDEFMPRGWLAWQADLLNPVPVLKHWWRWWVR